MPQNAPEGLSHKQIRALRALVRHSSIARAAAAAGVNEKTVDRWLKDPIFRDALIDAEWQLFDEAIRAGGAEMAEGMAIFTEVMRSTENAGVVRIKAAQALIDSVVKLHSHRQGKRTAQQQSGDDWIAAEGSNGDDDAGEAETEADDPDQDNT